MHCCLYLFNSTLQVSSRYSVYTKRPFNFEDKLFRTYTNTSMKKWP